VSDWTTFIAAVKAINIEKLKTRAKTEKELAEKERATKSEIKELWVQIKMLMLVRTTTTTQHAGQGQLATWTTTAQTNPNAPAPGRNCQMHAPATEAKKMATQQRLRTYPHQPDTDAGCTMYRRQMAQ
jgi:hypothetical protein